MHRVQRLLEMRRVQLWRAKLLCEAGRVGQETDEAAP
jgi:hypothetical protein